MPRLLYATPRSALSTALASGSLPLDGAARAVGSAVLAELDAVGAAYDAAWATYGATLTTRESAYTTALSSWVASFGALWADAADVAKYLEHRIYLARVGITLTPRVLSTPLGEEAITEHEDALPGPWANPEPAVTAARTLNASGAVPVLRIEALAEGIGGNATTVAVSAASSARDEECKIVLTRGTATGPYVETYDNVDLSAEGARAPDVSESLLVRSFTVVGVGRPVDLAAAHLTGGAGNVLDTMTARLERLVLAAQSGETALVETDRRTAEALNEKLNSIWSSLPVLDNPLQDSEDALQASIDRAEAHTALLTAVYP